MITTKLTYDLKEDVNYIRTVQRASLDKNVPHGLKVEDGLVFGSAEWFEAVDVGAIPYMVVRGKISRVYMAGHNDFPMFEITSDAEISQWERKGMDEDFIVDSNIELTYVFQKYKRPIGIVGKSKCILQIRIG